VTLDGTSLAPEGRVVELPRGESRLTITARRGDVTRSYALTVQRGTGLDAYLKADTVQPDAECGSALAASADTVVVGCVRGGVDGSGTGIVYVYRRADGAWTLEATLTASNASAGDRFGISVAM
jgi:hypothetical protein